MKIEDCILVPLTKITEVCDHDIDLEDCFGYPGIVGIHCFNENSTFFFHTSDCWFSVRDICDDLVFQRSIGSTQLSCARANHGLESLAVIIFHIGPTWESFEKREERMELIQQTWQHCIYTT